MGDNDCAAQQPPIHGRSGCCAAQRWGFKRNGRYRAALITYDSFDKDTRAKWIELFIDGKIDLLIVFQMLQTGFDAPRLKKAILNVSST